MFCILCEYSTKENVQLYNDRLQAGQETYENVNLEELEYQKSKS
jgi:hypothetical protein